MVLPLQREAGGIERREQRRNPAKELLTGVNRMTGRLGDMGLHRQGGEQRQRCLPPSGSFARHMKAVLPWQQKFTKFAPHHDELTMIGRADQDEAVAPSPLALVSEHPGTVVHLVRRSAPVVVQAAVAGATN